MTNQKLTTVVSLLVLGVVSAGAHSHTAKGQGSMIEAQATLPVSLGRLLYELGDTYDVFFTIEEAWSDSRRIDSLESHVLQRKSNKEDIQQELEELRQVIPNFTFQVNEASPRIFHIIDGRLAQQQGYGLDSILTMIDFTGKVRDLITEISDQGAPILQRNFFVIGDPFMLSDRITVLHVQGEGLKVRDALSNFIPLDEYNRVIWTTITRIGANETSINFRGPRRTY